MSNKYTIEVVADLRDVDYGWDYMPVEDNYNLKSLYSFFNTDYLYLDFVSDLYRYTYDIQKEYARSDMEGYSNLLEYGLMRFLVDKGFVKNIVNVMDEISEFVYTLPWPCTEVDGWAHTLYQVRIYNLEDNTFKSVVEFNR